MFDILFIKLHTQSPSGGGVPVPVGGAALIDLTRQKPVSRTKGKGFQKETQNNRPS